MNRYIQRILFLAIAVLMAAGVGLYAGSTPETTTIMVYMIGSDLESQGGCASNDLLEMQNSGVDVERVKLLVYTGGSEVWHSDQPEIPVESNGLYVLEEDGFAPVECFDLRSMGASENLTRFLDYSVENYPADCYDLILWNHGNGPVIGYGMDSLYGQDSLSLSELRQALEESPFGDGLKLDIVGFDACLMASAELVCTVGDFADYLVSSQETEPSFGWNYSFLGEAANISGEVLATYIANTYMDYCEAYFDGKELFQSDVTISAVKLDRAGELRQAINELFREAAGDAEEAFASLVTDRIGSRSFGRATTGSEYDLVDLASLSEHMQDAYPRETEAVLELVEDMVLVSRSNTDEVCGISLYYPFYNKTYYEADWREEYRNLDVFEDYGTYLETYENTWLGSDMRSVFADVKDPVQTSGGEYAIELTDDQLEQYASGGYYILKCNGGDNYSAVFSSSAVELDGNKLKAEYDGNVLYFTNQFGTKEIVPIREQDTVDGMTRYSAYPRLIAEKDGEIISCDCEILFSLNHTTGQTEVNGIYESDTSVKDRFENNSFDSVDALQSGKRQQMELSEYESLGFNMNQGRLMTRDDQGVLLDYWSWAADDNMYVYFDSALEDGIGFSRLPLYDDGYDYYLMFRYEDVQGNGYCSEPIAIEAQPEPKPDPKDDLMLSWEAGSTYTLYQAEGVTVKLCFVLDHDSGCPGLNLVVENETPHQVECVVGIDTVNGTVSDGSALNYSCGALPGAYGSMPLTGVNEALRVIGASVPEQLRFSYKVAAMTDEMLRPRTLKTLTYQEAVTLEFASDVKPVLTVMPWHGALADAQEIVTKDDVRFSLVYAGNQLGNEIIYGPSELTVLVQAENLGTEERLAALSGVVIGGCWFQDQSSMVLQPGQTGYLQCELSLGEAVDAWSPEGLMDVGDLSLVLTAEQPQYTSGEFIAHRSRANAALPGAEDIYPVALEEAAEETLWDVQPQSLIWTNGQLELWLAGYTEEEITYNDTTEYSWRLWLVNKGEDTVENVYLNSDVMIDGVEEAESELSVAGLYTFDCGILPGTGRWFYVSVQSEGDCPEVQFTICEGARFAFTSDMDALGAIRLTEGEATEVR